MTHFLHLNVCIGVFQFLSLGAARLTLLCYLHWLGLDNVLTFATRLHFVAELRFGHFAPSFATSAIWLGTFCNFNDAATVAFCDSW